MDTAQRVRLQWDFIIKFFEKEIPHEETERQKNQLEAYWCRPDGDNQELFRNHPKQRIFARLIKSYQNTTWHKVQLTIPNGEKGRKLITDHWFESRDIIKIAKEEIEANIFFKKRDSRNDFVPFCRMAADIVEKLELREYEFNEAQKDNFKSLSAVVSKVYDENKDKNDQDEDKLKISEFEKIMYECFPEPYKTIMKMQKLLPGLGIALTCDFLKESHLCNIAKPDVHISHVFSLLDGIPYSMDLALVKRVSEFATTVCPTKQNDFCNSGAYNVDKIIWMICSDYNTDSDGKKKSFKRGFLEKLAENISENLSW